MKEIKCPKCGTAITVDDAAFAALLSQVRTEEFNAEVNRRMEQLKQLQKSEEAKKVAEAAVQAERVAARHQAELSLKNQEIENRLRVPCLPEAATVPAQ